MEEKHIDSADLADAVVALVSRPNYQPVKPRVIAKKLGLPKERISEVRKVVKRLAKKGVLAYGAKHLVTLPGPVGSSPKAVLPKPSNVLTGTFRKAAAGFGFVRPKDPDVAKKIGEDIHVSETKTLDASNGDLVAVRLKKSGRAGDRIRGEIVEILERDKNQFVGVYFERSGMGFVQVDGKVFARPTFVGDAGAKNARSGDKVVIEMVHFPSHTRDGEAVIVEVLGARGTPGVDTMSIIREFNLPDEFSEDVLESARAQAERFEESIGEDRHDFTRETVVTIDPFDARDFDDAISLTKLENGHWRLGVHIADVSHFVPLGSPLDREARDRATSVYLPDRVIPMIPEVISNNLASLQPHRVRYTKTALIEFTPAGAPVATEVYCGAIKSAHRFNYEEIDEYLANPEPWRAKLAPKVFDLVGRMHELAMILRRRRLDAGSIELTLPEVKIDLDDDGKVSGAHLTKNTESHQIIEEFMLAANEAVATLLSDKELYFLRRVHSNPDPLKLKNLAQFMRELGIECESLESRFEIKRIVEQAVGRPEEHAVHYAVLRSMKKAVYSPEEEGHYALNSRNYCHFTSPIRRYPDLTIHRMVEAIVRGKTPPNDFEQLALLGEHCSEREQRAAAAERELIKVKLLTYLSSRVGQQMDAVITGVERFGLFATGRELPADGLIHISSLQDDNYQFDSDTHSLVGRRAGNSFRLGDLIRVEIAHVDTDRRSLDFRIVDANPAGAARRANGKSPRKATGERTAKGQRNKSSGSANKPKRSTKSAKTSPTKGKKGRGHK
ncbi:MAG: ribonuclease R [Planctomycetaceae bacterium]|nr:ribonuclease R [Planctomycetales bacterium]MCB9924088.1 ribonuclease R [Planctomycetaceae bacterium]